MQRWLHNLGYMTTISCSGPSCSARSSTSRSLERLQAEHPHVRYAHGFLIQQLVEGPRPVGEIAANLGVTSQAVSKSVRELEAIGYVERWSDPADGRVRRVALTDKGRAVLEAGRAVRARRSTPSWPRRSAPNGRGRGADAEGRADGARGDAGWRGRDPSRSPPQGAGPVRRRVGRGPRRCRRARAASRGSRLSPPTRRDRRPWSP